MPVSILRQGPCCPVRAPDRLTTPLARSERICLLPNKRGSQHHTSLRSQPLCRARLPDSTDFDDEYSGIAGPQSELDQAPVEAQAEAASSSGQASLAVTGLAANPSSFTTARQLVNTTAVLLRNKFWTIASIYLLADAAIFVLHRTSHRLTNALAIMFLGDDITQQSIGNLWWLTTNQEIANFASGYQWLVLLLFVLVFPLNVLFRTWAASATVLLCSDPATSKDPSPQRIIAVPPLRQVVATLKELWPRVKRVWPIVFVVDLLVAVRVLPLQALSLLVVTLFWTAPRIIDLQLANPVAVLEGAPGDLALARSARLAKPLRKALLWPFLLVILATRIVGPIRGLLLSRIPQRLYSQVPEVPIVVYLATVLVSVFFNRFQDLLPVVAYQAAIHKETSSGSDSSSTKEAKH
ncbi:hypothetical protein WJX72_010003 [[Myrmecia] bisecta]|uniref:Uncharacterized protein n=1 Tax=[Myrmecia] bisecta TaxID=41462 RepID=A0AAW1Q5H1_9CHLO